MLDRLLEDERIAFEGLSATSAGAMNAVTMAYGMTLGGREGARKALTAILAARRPCRHGQPVAANLVRARVKHNHSLENSPAFVMFDLISRLYSPYQFNPLNYNPLRQVLEQSVDFENAAREIRA